MGKEFETRNGAFVFKAPHRRPPVLPSSITLPYEERVAAIRADACALGAEWVKTGGSALPEDRLLRWAGARMANDLKVTVPKAVANRQDLLSRPSNPKNTLG